MPDWRRRELIAQDFHVERIRKAGGGRKRVEKTPEMISRIEELIQNDLAGDPITGTKWRMDYRLRLNRKQIASTTKMFLPYVFRLRPDLIHADLIHA